MGVENLGRKGKDKVTGLEGVITAYSFWLYGCNNYLLQPVVDEKGSVPDAKWFDEGRIELLSEKAIQPADVRADKNGCDSAPTER